MYILNKELVHVKRNRKKKYRWQLDPGELVYARLPIASAGAYSANANLTYHMSNCQQYNKLSIITW